jgi:hypothetical protein
MQAEMGTKTEKLVGKYFHSANENDKVEWQGVVIGEPHPGILQKNYGQRAVSDVLCFVLP